jgi:hypothetical protein
LELLRSRLFATEFSSNHLNEAAAFIAKQLEECSLTLARESTALPAQVAVDADEELSKSNQQLTDGRSLERRSSATFEPTPQEFIVSNPLTPSKVELMKEDEKAPIKNILQGYRKLNSR